MGSTLVGMLAVLVVIAALVFIITGGVQRMGRKMSGWNALLQQYPAPAVRETGESFVADAFIHGTKYIKYQSRGGFRIGFAKEGFLVTPNFARNDPILIPWSAVLEVSGINGGIMGSNLCITVQHQRCIQFFLPGSVQPILQKYVPADRMHNPISIREAITNRLHGR